MGLLWLLGNHSIYQVFHRFQFHGVRGEGLARGITSLPVLLTSGPLKMRNEPSMNLALAASAAFRASALAPGPYADGRQSPPSGRRTTFGTFSPFFSRVT